MVERINIEGSKAAAEFSGKNLAKCLIIKHLPTQKNCLIIS
jgi:hypothetical protein